ncbi:MAG: hypothetical protein AAGI01_04270 [Myxococcota bacterium]
MRSWRTVVGTGFAWIALALSIGCSRDLGQIEVELCGDVAVPEDIDAVRVIFLDEQRREAQSGLRELLLCPQEEVLELPQSFGFPEVLGEVTIRVQGIKDGLEVLTSERKVTVEQMRATPKFTLPLTRDCRGVQCPLGQTCQGGTCALTPSAADAPIRCVSVSEPVSDEGMGEAPEPEPDPEPGADGSEVDGPVFCTPEEVR